MLEIIIFFIVKIEKKNILHTIFRKVKITNDVVQIIHNS